MGAGDTSDHHVCGEIEKVNQIYHAGEVCRITFRMQVRQTHPDGQMVMPIRQILAGRLKRGGNDAWKALDGTKKIRFDNSDLGHLLLNGFDGGEILGFEHPERLKVI
jgi:hypothetical protein